MTIAELPFHEIEMTAIKSRGPGGQNVNKTNSAIQLRWNLKESQFFPDAIHYRLLGKLSSQLTIAGEIIIRSDSSRDQEMNRKDSLAKLANILTQALFVPKKRVKTKPTRSSKERRLKGKSQRSEIKKGRSSKWD